MSGSNLDQKPLLEKPGQSVQPTDASIPVTPNAPAKRPYARVFLHLVFVYTLFVIGLDVFKREQILPFTKDHKHAAKCPAQAEAILKGMAWDVPSNYSHYVSSRLSKAVQIPAVSYDDMGPVNEDPRWEPHAKFNAFLQSEFPVVYDTLQHELVNTYAHLFTWQGTNKDLQPIILMAHQDVVPVLPATLDLWDHPPFQGHYDAKWIYGRGAGDCKNQLMGIMNAVEKLIVDGFKPERTVLISFGFDEEIGGVQGADHLSAEILKRYGPDSISLLVDEGFGGVDETYGAKVASLGMAEKGAVNFKVTVETPGGHSSVPPEHTAIGYLADILVHFESNPFPVKLSPAEPYLNYLSCLAEYAPDIPASLKKAIVSPRKWDRLAKKLAKESLLAKAFMGTTQAIDIIEGGVKVNALPEVATAIINHRVAFTSSVDETKVHIHNILAPLARKWKFSYKAFGHEVYPELLDGSHHITLDIQSNGKSKPVGLEPAPITPSDNDAFDLMAGTIKGVFGNDTVVAPSGMFANTDTRAYWDLTRNIYRFIPGAVAGFKNVHTVNEAVSVEGHVSTIRFFYTLIQNSKGWRHGNEH